METRLDYFVIVIAAACVYVFIKEIRNSIKLDKEMDAIIKEMELRHKKIFEKEMNRMKEIELAKIEEAKRVKNKELYEVLSKNIL